MNRFFIRTLLSAALVVFSHLGWSEGVPEKTESIKTPFDSLPFVLPKEDSFLYEGYRKSWNRLTGFEYSGLHWKQFVAIFSNKGLNIYRENYLAYLSLYRDDEDEDEDDEDEPEAFKEYEVGTIFLKENYIAEYGKPGSPSSLTIMIKRQDGFDSKGGNWEYLQSDTAGNMIMRGDSSNPEIKSACSDCHSNMAERDYIFSTFLTGHSGY